MQEVRAAKSGEARSSIYERIRQLQEQYRAANPRTELPPAEIEVRRLKMEEMLKTDPFRWQMYKLRQSLASAKTAAESERILYKMRTLREKHDAEARAMMTPEQRAEQETRSQKYARMQAELKPLEDRMRESSTLEGRNAVRAQMLKVIEKYR